MKRKSRSLIEYYYSRADRKALSCLTNFQICFVYDRIAGIWPLAPSQFLDFYTLFIHSWLILYWKHSFLMSTSLISWCASKNMLFTLWVSRQKDHRIDYLVPPLIMIWGWRLILEIRFRLILIRKENFKKGTKVAAW